MAAEEGVNLDLNYALKNWQGKDLKVVFEDLNRLKGGSIKPSFEQDFANELLPPLKTISSPFQGP